MPALTTAEVLARAIARHGDRYTYEKFAYINSTTKCIITCRVHGDFSQLPLNHTDNHLDGDDDVES